MEENKFEESPMIQDAMKHNKEIDIVSTLIAKEPELVEAIEDQPEENK